MSTPNFARCYFSRVYALSDDECTDMVVDNTREHLLCLLPTASSAEGWVAGVGYHGGQVLVSIDTQVGIWSITHEIVLMGGYYAGANLDVVVTISRDSAKDGWEQWSTAERDSLSHLPKHVEQMLDKVDKRIEKALELATQPLRVVAVMSNGEAIYEKAG